MILNACLLLTDVTQKRKYGKSSSGTLSPVPELVEGCNISYSEISLLHLNFTILN